MWIGAFVTRSKATHVSLPAYSLQSVRNALRTIRVLQERQELSVSEVATELGVGMSTAHRLLSTLKLESFVSQSMSTKKYLLGPVMSAFPPERLLNEYADVAKAPMRKLSDEVGETVHLAVRQGRDVRFVAVEESRKLVHLTSRVGMTLPIHSTSSGKSLLAYLPATELNRLFPAEQIEKLTPGTVSTRAELLAQLKRIKKQGYAVNEEESEEDLHAAAVPVFDRSGVPIASITVAGPKYRFRVSQVHMKLPCGLTVIEMMQQAARVVTKAVT